MKPTLEFINGVACIKEGFTLSDEPVIVFNYWPIGSGAEYCREFEGSEVEKGGACCLYQLRLAPYNWVTIGLIDGGKTKAIKQEEQVVARPKTRCQVRWKNGRWEKLLKARGWVLA